MENLTEMMAKLKLTEDCEVEPMELDEIECERNENIEWNNETEPMETDNTPEYQVLERREQTVSFLWERISSEQTIEYKFLYEYSFSSQRQ